MFMIIKLLNFTFFLACLQKLTLENISEALDHKMKCTQIFIYVD